MLKIPEKLRNKYVLIKNDGNLDTPFTAISGDELADEIQAEVDKFYLPRPLFEDGTLVQLGEYHDEDGDLIQIKEYAVTSSGITIVYGDETIGGLYKPSMITTRLLIRPRCDTQEHINDDATLDPAYYCGLYEIELSDDPDHEECEQKKTLHLLERQRKLMEREA